MRDPNLYDPELSDDQVEELIDHRGGCRCCISPPCWAHTEPCTLNEALELGFIEEPEGVTEGDRSAVWNAICVALRAPVPGPAPPEAASGVPRGLQTVAPIAHRLGRWR